jgi:hypothetical protein
LCVVIYFFNCCLKYLQMLILCLDIWSVGNITQSQKKIIGNILSLLKTETNYKQISSILDRNLKLECLTKVSKGLL